jgi:CheY-like chemotaxis protein
MAREKGFKAWSPCAATAGLALARECKPDAITLDLRSRCVDGWIVLDRLKHDPRTRHIPVHVISASDTGRRRSLELGAEAYLEAGHRGGAPKRSAT